MTERQPYIDHSPSALINEQAIAMAQQHLIDLGYDLGPAGADGDWGPRSQAAATDWQRINNYHNSAGEITGDITMRQMDALAVQAADPSIFERIELDGFYRSFDRDALSHLDPVRSAVLLQAAAHIGVKESGVIPGTDEGNNAGVDVKAYLGAYHMDEGNPWCASFGSWAFDQVERFADIPRESFMDGNPGVISLVGEIQKSAPEALRDASTYTPQGGDMILIINEHTGNGHFVITTTSTDIREDGARRIATIEGNANDSIRADEMLLYTDPASGQSYPAILDESTDPPQVYLDPAIKAYVVDISALPGFDSMSNGFNRSAEFVPTAPRDPEFKPDVENLAVLESELRAHQDAMRPQLPNFFGNAPEATRPTSAFNGTMGPT